MKNSKSLFLDVIGWISLKESESEVRAIATHLIESICGLTSADMMAGKPVSASDEAKLQEAVARINRFEPLQYILNEVYFFGRKFYVDPAVLIPRPETEQLVALIIDRADKKSRSQRIFDVATGSGCLAISLDLELSPLETWGTDISEAALVVARRNAALLGSRTNLVLHDVLTGELPVNEVAIVASNPPYIAEREKETMERNVLDHEPHLALFVPDSNPLVFYDALSANSQKVLVPGGLLAVEINERFGKEVATLMTEAGLQRVELVKDLAGKDRFVFARKGT
ncbi:MAG TPA: peptide chain release factor N(5)-glutamine methyltransferase [Chryseolinea sp.]|nr:peptide chain release factor N(5)-glutamine methyltransferase [Chryseolinea sp.]